ncbi:MAG: hypothetical protein OXT71_16425 [Acidobacteriota bacterium]|nr:hypothetical protein [Acidobacteriota bacterium]
MISVSLWWILVALLAVFVLWFTAPLYVERTASEYRTQDGDIITVKVEFDGKQATAEIVVSEHKGEDIGRALDAAVTEAESRYGKLEFRRGWADPAAPSRAERVRTSVRRLLVRD